MIRKTKRSQRRDAEVASFARGVPSEDSEACAYRGEQPVSIVECTRQKSKVPAFRCACKDVKPTRCIVRLPERLSPEGRKDLLAILGHDNTDYQNCAECDHKLNPRIKKTTPITRTVEILSQNISFFQTTGWNQWENARAAQSTLLNRSISRLKPLDSSLSFVTSQDRGIVTLGGSERYFICAFVLVAMLREVGCTLPIEVWHIGKSEWRPPWTPLIEHYDVTVVNLDERIKDMPVPPPRMMGGWEAKIWAIQFSPFRNVLFLDADQCPPVDPTYLFDDQRFKECGAILWPDIPDHCDIRKEAFSILKLPTPLNSRLPKHKNPSDYRSIESGQLLFDKTKCWETLSLIRFIADHSDFWWKSQAYFFGDKSSYYLGFERMRTPYLVPENPGWIGGGDTGGSYLQKDLDGKVVFQHRCQPKEKFRLDGNNSHPKEFIGGEFVDKTIARLSSLMQQGVKKSQLVPVVTKLHTPALDPDEIITIDLGYKATNPSVTKDGDNVLAIYSSSQHIGYALLNADMKTPHWQKESDEPISQEPSIPRWFYHDGFQCASFAIGQSMAHQRYDEGDDLHVINYRNYPVERNWAFFGHESQLFAVYECCPHRIIEISGNDAVQRYSSEWRIPRRLGLLRGGASPVLHNGEFYHWCHNAFIFGNEQCRAMCLYTFKGTPPFNPLRLCDRMVMRTDPHRYDSLVCYPSGAFHDNSKWYVSFGPRTEIAVFDENDVESSLTKLA